MSIPVLTLRERRFVEEYLIHLNATKAAKLAGYSASTAQQIGSAVLAKPKIQAAMKIAQRAHQKSTGVTVDRIVLELAKIGFANIMDFVAIQEDGSAYVDLSNMSREQSAAIAEINVEEYMEGRGDDARPVKRTKIKMADKRAALVDMGKHLGMFVERKVVDVNTNDKPLTDEERRERIAELIGREATERIIEATGGGEEIPSPPITH